MLLRSPRRGEVWLAAASVAFVLGMGEAVVRMAGLGAHGATGYAPVNTSRPSRRHLNTRGYRDVERSLAKPPGVRRVVCLGDSFAWGHGIEREDALPARLERALRRGGADWEVVNLAREGMNTVDEAAQLEAEGFAYAPDVVLLVYVLNDSEDAAAAEARRAAEWAEGPAPSWLDVSALARLVRYRLWATVENRRRVEGYVSMYAADASGWRAAQAALKRMGDACRAHGAPLVVAVFPLLGNPLDERYPFAALHAQVARAARAVGAEVVDLLPAFRGLRPEALVVDGVDDEHPNEVAQRIATGPVRQAIEAVVPAP